MTEQECFIQRGILGNLLMALLPLFSALVLMGVISGCYSPPGELPELHPDRAGWKHEIGDKVMHRVGVQAIVIDRRYSDKHPYPEYSSGGKQKWEQYQIRYISVRYGLSEDWVLEVELDAVEVK